MLRSEHTTNMENTKFSREPNLIWTFLFVFFFLFETNAFLPSAVFTIKTKTVTVFGLYHRRTSTHTAYDDEVVCGKNSEYPFSYETLSPAFQAHVEVHGTYYSLCMENCALHGSSCYMLTCVYVWVCSRYMDGWVLFVVHDSSRCEIQCCLFYALRSRCSLGEVGKKALCVDCSMTNQRTQYLPIHRRYGLFAIRVYRTEWENGKAMYAANNYYYQLRCSFQLHVSK